MKEGYHVEEALAGLQSLPSGSVNLVVTDPAYNTMEKWRAQGTTTRLSHSKSSSNDWFPVVDMEYLGDCISECYRVLQNNSYLFVMCDFFTGIEVHSAAIAAGFDPKKPLIWEKVGKRMTVVCPTCHVKVTEIEGRGSPGMGYPFRSGYEMIYFAQKGKRKPPQNKSIRDVLRYPRLKGDNLWPTQKPIDLLKVLIELSSAPGDLVLDPFAGSGSTLVAAALLERKYLGFDVDCKGKDYFQTLLGEHIPKVLPSLLPKRDGVSARKKAAPIFRMFSGQRTESGENG